MNRRFDSAPHLHFLTATTNAQVSSYTPTLLNTYATRTVPGSFEVLAAAAPGATVSYEYPADSGLPATLPRMGNFLYRQVPVDNSAGAVDAQVKITGVKNNVGPAGEDAVTEITRGIFVPQTPEAYSYDADGNLTGDGQWSYAWDAENRLQKMERTAIAPGGLVGQYYNFTSGTIWTGPADLTRVDAVDFDWGISSPGTGIGADKFNVLWTGLIEAPVTGDYVFESESDDGAEIWVGGVEIVANWGQRNGNSVAQGSVHLAAGQKYPLKIYYLNIDGPAVMKLRWRKPGDSVTTIIPADRLYHPTASLPPLKLEFAYDGQGRRVSKNVSNWDGSSWLVASSVLYLHDGWNLIAECDAQNNNAPVHTFAWGLDLSGSFQGAGGVGGLLFTTISSPSSTYAPAYDGNGNVIAYVDMATGVKSATYEYGAFGETLVSDGVAAEAMPFRFSTRYTDNETGLIYYGRRYMRDGRFLSKDPLQERGGANLYGFVGNDAVNSFDYLGLLKFDFKVPFKFGTKQPIPLWFASVRWSIEGEVRISIETGVAETDCPKLLPSNLRAIAGASWLAQGVGIDVYAGITGDNFDWRTGWKIGIETEGDSYLKQVYNARFVRGRYNSLNATFQNWFPLIEAQGKTYCSACVRYDVNGEQQFDARLYPGRTAALAAVPVLVAEAEIAGTLTALAKYLEWITRTTGAPTY